MKSFCFNRSEPLGRVTSVPYFFAVSQALYAFFCVVSRYAPPMGFVFVLYCAPTKIFSQVEFRVKHYIGATLAREAERPNHGSKNAGSPHLYRSTSLLFFPFFFTSQWRYIAMLQSRCWQIWGSFGHVYQFARRRSIDRAFQPKRSWARLKVLWRPREAMSTGGKCCPSGGEGGWRRDVWEHLIPVGG